MLGFGIERVAHSMWCSTSVGILSLDKKKTYLNGLEKIIAIVTVIFPHNPSFGLSIINFLTSWWLSPGMQGMRTVGFLPTWWATACQLMFTLAYSLRCNCIFISVVWWRIASSCYHLIRTFFIIIIILRKATKINEHIIYKVGRQRPGQF